MRQMFLPITMRIPPIPRDSIRCTRCHVDRPISPPSRCACGCPEYGMNPEQFLEMDANTNKKAKR